MLSSFKLANLFAMLSLLVGACSGHLNIHQATSQGKVNREVTSTRKDPTGNKDSTLSSNPNGIMSFNMWGLDSHDRFASFAAAMNMNELPDLIFLQEVMAQKGHEDLSTAHFLARLLKLNVSFRQRPNSNEGLAILSRYPISTTYIKYLSYAPSDPYNRIAIATQIEHPDFGRLIAVNVHLASERNNASLRSRQLNDVWLFIRSFPQVDTIIVGGDFNAFPTDSEMLIFAQNWQSKFGSWGFVQDELFTAPTWADVGNGDDFHTPRAERLDYIFMGSKKALIFGGEKRLFEEQVPSSPRVFNEKGLKKVWVSDHLPVLHRFESPK